MDKKYKTSNCKVLASYDISSFTELKLFKSKVHSIIADLNKVLRVVDDMDGRTEVYGSSVIIRKTMQKIKQKAHHIRQECLTIRKMEEHPQAEGKTIWCPDPDFAFDCCCDMLGPEDSCKDNKDCLLCSKD